MMVGGGIRKDLVPFAQLCTKSYSGKKKEALPVLVTVTKLMSCNRARLALLSEAQQAVARQGATERFWEDRDWQWLYNAYRVPIEQAAASAAGWDALPRGILPRQLEVCLAQALDALDEGKLTVPSPDGEPPVVMGLFGPIGRSESAPPAVEPLQAHTPSVARLPPPLPRTARPARGAWCGCATQRRTANVPAVAAPWQPTPDT